MDNYKTLVQQAFRDIFETPVYDEAIVEKYFDKDYIQHVDGKTLNFEQFKQHLQTLKAHTRSLQFDFETVVQEGDIVFTNHLANVINAEGSAAQARVIAEFNIRNGRIVYCSELTFLIKGDAKDRDLGSR